jgi:hypothetical protein
MRPGLRRARRDDDEHGEVVQPRGEERDEIE